MKTPASPVPFSSRLQALCLLGLFSASAFAHDAPAPDYGLKAKGEILKDYKKPPPILKGTIPGEALDEANMGQTVLGTPISQRTPECFPAESRDVFWKMDMVADPKTGQLKPLNFDVNGNGKIDDIPNPELTGRNPLANPTERDAIRGRNTWLVWGGGNEVFWGWLQERGYGLVDFLILMDSRTRGSRFKTGGLINQPGFQPNADPGKRILGLYLDIPQKDKIIIQPPPDEFGPDGKPLIHRPEAPPNHKTQLFVPGNKALYENTRKAMAYDGLDPDVYGYASGIFGLRLFLNPDFFGATADAEKARARWDERVVKTNDRYYTDAKLHSDPSLVRPFRVTMSCGFCHVGPHPLNPPTDVENPEWENLSSIIGAQYWSPQPSLGNLTSKRNFLHHFLKSQSPGTVDTSLVSTDHINNTNVMNAIFDLPARLTRALNKPTELQSPESLLMPSIEDPDTSMNPDGPNKQRHFPMVLFPGEDSIGVFGALARVPLNVGVFSEEWGRCDNQVIGYTPQRPFQIKVCQANSVYWQVNEKFRVPYMANFFTLGQTGTVPKSTAAMKLKDAGPKVGAPAGTDGRLATLGQEALQGDSQAKIHQGREIFLNNCAICHSSKQPTGFDLRFTRETPAGGWEKSPTPSSDSRYIYTLPSEYTAWDQFKQSPSYQDYTAQIRALAGPAPADESDDLFIKDNFMSNELRIPVTLVGTYAGRALATNATKGQIWDNYSSETFKHLPSVGKIQYYNPFAANASDAKRTPYGTNAEFDDGRKFGGPGYFRPASLISVWATAPYFHNNELGLYNHDPSVKGRLEAFDDGIRKLLWKDRRSIATKGGLPRPGDLRAENSDSAKNDPGFIYRVPVDTFAIFESGFIPLLIKGLLTGTFGAGPANILFSILTFWWWIILGVIFLVLVFRARARQAGLLLLTLALIASALLLLTGAGGGGTVMGALMMGSTGLLGHSSLFLWLVVAGLLLASIALLMTRKKLHVFSRGLFLVATLVTLFVGILANKFLNGRLKDVNPVLAVLPNSWLNADYKGINVGPIPRGTPVNLIMNLDPDKRSKVVPALIALLKAMAEIKEQNLEGEEAYKVLAAQAGQPLMDASKCPDFVLDRGHYFGETLDPDPKKNDEAKEALISFLKTL